jgi:lauroyl/myristoyl acyltransferase
VPRETLVPDPPVRPSAASLLLLEALSRIAVALGPAGRCAAAGALAAIDRSVSAGRRDGLRANLERLGAWGHPLARTPGDRARTARAIFRAYHLGVIEHAAARGAGGGADAIEDVAFSGAERLYRALSEGRGAVVTAPHLGSWERAGIAIARLGFRVHVVTGVQYHAAVAAAVRERKERERLAVSTPEDGFLPLLATLRRGGLVVLLADGDVHRRSRSVRLFGAPCSIPVGPALLARRAGAPIVHAHAARDDRDHARDRISFDSSDRPDRALSVAADVARMTEGVARALERAIAAHLTEWCIFRPLFDDPASLPQGAARGVRARHAA